MFFTIVLQGLLFTAVDAMSLRHGRQVSTDPLINMFRQQEQAMQQLSSLVANVSNMLVERIEKEHDQTQRTLERMETRLYSICPTTHYIAVGQSCYKLYTEGSDWFEARKRCQADGAQLVAIETAEEQEVVVQLIMGYPSRPVWTGGNDLDTEGHFVWNATGSDLHYTNWMGGQPNNYGGSQHCVEIAPTTQNRKWNDESCNSHRRFTLCEAYRPDQNRG